MAETRLEFDGVWKKFRKGDYTRSLRDALPAIARRWFKQPPPPEIAANEFWSLKNLDFGVTAGECVGIIGNNGAGKSTLLKCAARILRPNRGAVRVRGRVSALIEVGAGFHPDLTGRENVFLNGTILGMRRREIADRFDQIVAFSGMAGFIDTPVKRYSSGMYARLGFSVAAFMDPDVLLIDEVLSVGDMNFARKCERKIQEIVAGDTTVLFVSHNLAAVRMICDRVIVLRMGEVVFDGPADEAIHAYHRMLGEEDNSGQCHPAVQRLRLSLGDATARTIESVEPGETLTLDAELTAEHSIGEASIGYSVQDEEGRELFAVRMDELGIEPADLAPGATLRVRFRFAANLMPGVYWLGTTVRGRVADQPMSEPIILEQTPNRLPLPVAGSAEGRGPVHLFASCEADVDAVVGTLRVPSADPVLR